MVKRVVLAYSGGLDTSIIIPWLEEKYGGCEVHCLAGDVGQGEDELAGLEEKAAESGAASCRVADCRQEFLEEVVWPCLMAGAIFWQKEREAIRPTTRSRTSVVLAFIERDA